MSSELPAGISQIMEHIGDAAAAYGHLKWNEESKLKADMMNMPERWLPVSAAALESKCREIGLRDEDTALVLDLLHRRKAGRRLIPRATYRDFRFATPIDPIDSPRSQSW